MNSVVSGTLRRLAFGLVLAAAACGKSEPDGSAAGKPSAEPPASAERAPIPPLASAPPVVSGAPLAAASSSVALPVASASAAPAKKARVRSGAQDFEVLDPGAEPRTALRYGFEVGRTERMKLVNGTTITVDVGGRKAASPQMPDLEVFASLKTLSVGADGSAKRELLIERAELASGAKIDEAVRAELARALKGIQNLKGRDSIDARGRLKAIELDTAGLEGQNVGQLMDQMQQSFAQLGAPFPEEPVGVGARWTVTNEVAQQGMRLRQVATYELTELKGRKGRAKIKLKQVAPRGKVQPPGMPPNVQAELLGMNARGEGEIEFDLDRTIPEGQIKTRATVKIRTTAGAESQDTAMDLNVRVKFVPLD